MKQRKCLKCDQPFESEGPHNRLCDKCRTSNYNLALRHPGINNDTLPANMIINAPPPSHGRVAKNDNLTIKTLNKLIEDGRKQLDE